MRLFKLGFVGVLTGVAAIALASPASAKGASVAGSQASRGAVAVAGGGHLHNSRLVGRPKHRSQPRPWWDAHGGPANPAGSYLGYVNGRPGRSDGLHIWLGDGHRGHGGHNGHDGGHGDHDGHGGHWRDHRSDFEDDYFYGGYYGYDEDGDAYVETIPLLDQYGFFATGGQVIQRDGQQPVYAYDRGYPYEWYGGRAHAAAAPPPPPMMAPMGGMGPGMAPMGPGMSSGIRCEVQSTYDEANSHQAEVRVCRGW
jgi:hypothetical protein